MDGMSDRMDRIRQAGAGSKTKSVPAVGSGEGEEEPSVSGEWGSSVWKGGKGRQAGEKKGVPEVSGGVCSLPAAAPGKAMFSS